MLESQTCDTEPAPAAASASTLHGESVEAARSAGLYYVCTEAPGITRRRSGQGFSYRSADDQIVRERKTLERIRRLAIPPAWREVWICSNPRGHIQAVGYDQRGRRQYLYHERFRQVRDENKYRHLIDFAGGLPRLRSRVARDMAQTASGRRQVLATVVNLLESTMIRIGNPAYARANGSFGLTTLESRHVQIRGTTLRFRFRGKSGKEWKLDIRDRRMVRIIKACQELPGQNLFGYVDETGACQTVTSADVNEYLRQISGRDITAKDFRTWNGTVVAATMLSLENGEDHTLSARKRNLTAVVRSVAATLGNTSAVCRKSYIHPDVVEAYLEGSLDLNDVAGSPVRGLRPEECRVALFLRARERAKSAA